MVKNWMDGIFIRGRASGVYLYVLVEHLCCSRCVSQSFEHIVKLGLGLFFVELFFEFGHVGVDFFG